MVTDEKIFIRTKTITHTQNKNNVQTVKVIHEIMLIFTNNELKNINTKNNHSKNIQTLFFDCENQMI